MGQRKNMIADFNPSILAIVLHVTRLNIPMKIYQNRFKNISYQSSG